MPRRKYTDQDLADAYQMIHLKTFHRNPGERMKLSIAKAGAVGIAYGRNQGVEATIKIFEDELSELAKRLRRKYSN